MKRARTKITGVMGKILLTGSCIFLLTISGWAQISPGELAKPHAQLEGILNCTKCHVLGDKVSNDKCLACHTDLKSQITQRKGYHASTDVSGKDCFACHSDHHGRNFDIVRFDEARFDHNLTGYKLTGAHAKQECKACHTDENIDSYEIRKKEFTYLGLKTDCVLCHTDVHKNTLTTQCASCHTTEAFAPATRFDHSKTSFPLKGKHKTVDCKSCHEVTLENGTEFQRFSGVLFASCASCHDDVHDGAFGTNCRECHTEESFSAFAGKNTFNHAQTKFPLTGKHRRLDCASCHEMGSKVDAQDVFQEYKNKNINTCVTCHDDVHESKFGIDCRKCHTEESFQMLLNPTLFKHELTGYPLEGKHYAVDCRKCHEGKMTEPLRHQRCMDCHDDYHQGELVREDISPDCRDCHTVQGFAGSTFTIERHNEGVFPLTGAHLATPCFSCHLKEEQWTFRNIGLACNVCHTDVHEGDLDEKYYPQKTCDMCHSPDGWAAVSFDHLSTGFELAGTHTKTACISCHQAEEGTQAESRVVFKGQLRECSSCHENVHDRQFESEGVTDCTRCHDYDAWKPSRFDHSTARFVLDGAHSKVDCRECHKEETVDGRKAVQYRLERFECVDCHL